MATSVTTPPFCQKSSSKNELAWRESLRGSNQAKECSTAAVVPNEVLDRFHSVQTSVERRWKRLQRDVPDLENIPTPVLFSLSEHERKLHVEKQSIMCKVVASLEDKGRLLKEQLLEVKKSQKNDHLRFEKLQEQYLTVIKRITQEIELSRVNTTIDGNLRSSLSDLEQEKEVLLEGLEASRRELEEKSVEFQKSQQELILAWKFTLQDNEDLRRDLVIERAQCSDLRSRLTLAESTIADLTARLEAQISREQDPRTIAENVKASSDPRTWWNQDHQALPRDREPASMRGETSSYGPRGAERDGELGPGTRASMRGVPFDGEQRQDSTASSSQSPPLVRRPWSAQKHRAAASTSPARRLPQPHPSPGPALLSHTAAAAPRPPRGGRTAHASAPRSRGVSDTDTSRSDSDSDSPPPPPRRAPPAAPRRLHGLLSAVAPVASAAPPPPARLARVSTPPPVRSGPRGPQSPPDGTSPRRSRPARASILDGAAAGMRDGLDSDSDSGRADGPAGPSRASAGSTPPSRRSTQPGETARRRRRQVARDWERIRRAGPAARAGSGRGGGGGV